MRVKTKKIINDSLLWNMRNEKGKQTEQLHNLSFIHYIYMYKPH